MFHRRRGEDTTFWAVRFGDARQQLSEEGASLPLGMAGGWLEPAAEHAGQGDERLVRPWHIGASDGPDFPHIYQNEVTLRSGFDRKP